MQVTQFDTESRVARAQLTREDLEQMLARLDHNRALAADRFPDPGDLPKSAGVGASEGGVGAVFLVAVER